MKKRKKKQRREKRALRGSLNELLDSRSANNYAPAIDNIAADTAQLHMQVMAQSGGRYHKGTFFDQQLLLREELQFKIIYVFGHYACQSSNMGNYSTCRPKCTCRFRTHTERTFYQPQAVGEMKYGSIDVIGFFPKFGQAQRQLVK